MGSQAFIFSFGFLRQDFPAQTWLFWNSFCSPGQDLISYDFFSFVYSSMSQQPYFNYNDRVSQDTVLSMFLEHLNDVTCL